MSETDAETDKLLTVIEVAERLRLHPETIRRWLRAGHLSGVWLGSDSAGWRVREADLAAFLSSRSTRKGSRERSRLG
ncbi:MAG: Helix-turn-helix domain [Burkholderiales bacterium]|jgi:excisionase family DNA binding protein|nr:Helix-turn-helix domain [Burkholderiales bacterium]